MWEYDNWQGDEPNGGEEENCLEMVGYAEGDKAAGWWNDIHCSHNKTRSYVCSYDNGTELIPICFQIFLTCLNIYSCVPAGLARV